MNETSSSASSHVGEVNYFWKKFSFLNGESYDHVLSQHPYCSDPVRSASKLYLHVRSPDAPVSSWWRVLLPQRIDQIDANFTWRVGNLCILLGTEKKARCTLWQSRSAQRHCAILLLVLCPSGSGLEDCCFLLANDNNQRNLRLWHVHKLLHTWSKNDKTNP